MNSIFPANHLSGESVRVIMRPIPNWARTMSCRSCVPNPSGAQDCPTVASQRHTPFRNPDPTPFSQGESIGASSKPRSVDSRSDARDPPLPTINRPQKVTTHRRHMPAITFIEIAANGNPATRPRQAGSTPNAAHRTLRLHEILPPDSVTFLLAIHGLREKRPDLLVAAT